MFKIQNLIPMKSSEKGSAFDCDKLKYLTRKKGTISADHAHGESENLYLMQGKARLTVDKKEQLVEAPVKISIQGGVYHKLEAITDLVFLENRER